MMVKGYFLDKIPNIITISSNKNKNHFFSRILSNERKHDDFLSRGEAEWKNMLCFLEFDKISGKKFLFLLEDEVFF